MLPVQNFPFFSIMLSMVSGVLCILLRPRAARAVTLGSIAAVAVMSLLTLLGKISAKLADAVELAPDELPALRRALCKRIVADLNDAIGLQNFLLNNAGNEEAVSHLCSLGTQLRVIREDVLAMLFRARGGSGRGTN